MDNQHDALQVLADKVVITNATGNEKLFLAAVRELLAGVRALATTPAEPAQPERVALTDWQLIDGANNTELWGLKLGEIFAKGARFAEAMHGIGGPK
jgi:hypothetical protein